MKITFLTPHVGISGGVKLILSYADRFAKRGHEVTVVCPEKYIEGRMLYGPSRAIRARTMSILKKKPTWCSVSARLKYVPSFDERYIPSGDVIVATAWQTAPYVAQYSRNKGEKFYLFMHYERLLDEGCDDVDRFTYKLRIKKMVISSLLKDILKNSFDEDSVLIKTPVDLHIFYPTREVYKKAKRICMLNHSSKWKGVADGIEAFRIAKDKHPDLELVMFGNSAQGSSIECEYHLRPSNDQLRAIFNSCDVFVCSSWREGFGLPSAEAMACKCALATTDTGGSRDFALHQKTALVSPPRNPKRLADNLMLMLDDQTLMERLAEAGHDHISSFRWEDAVNRMEKLFEESNV